MPLRIITEKEAFSPNDLVCAALSSCMMTLMGILAEREGIPLAGLKSEITKIMASNPRRIAEIQIVFHILRSRQLIFRSRNSLTLPYLPVACSLREDIKQTISFNW